MAPRTPEVLANLEKRGSEVSQSIGYEPGTKDFDDFIKKFVDTRNIPPTVIEDAIQNTVRVAGKWT